ncbi:MAG: hypothetical protein ACI8WT_003973, partial [Clostridium sp.]
MLNSVLSELWVFHNIKMSRQFNKLPAHFYIKADKLNSLFL